MRDMLAVPGQQSAELLTLLKGLIAAVEAKPSVEVKPEEKPASPGVPPPSTASTAALAPGVTA
eukprot:6608905-Alexandrium_andersonii.AAC.1